MPLLDITKPEIVKFLNASYEKTERLRMKWSLENAEKIKEAATLHREERGYHDTDVTKKAMLMGMTDITRNITNSARHRKTKHAKEHVLGIEHLQKGHSIVEVGLGDPKEDPRVDKPDTDFSPEPVMRPVNPKIKEIIYKDKPVDGRLVYLNKRHEMAPEDKFYFSECSSWDYGWRLNDSQGKKSAPTYGRVWALTKSQKVRSGPHPDPPHYKDSTIPDACKCPPV